MADPNLNASDDEILGSLNQPGAAGAEPAQDPGAAPQEPQFDPNQFGYKFRNETVFPKDRNEVTELMQLGRSLRENKPKWDPILQRWEQNKDTYQRYDALREAIAQNPEFARELNALAQKYSQQPQPNAQPQAQSDLPPDIKAKLDKIEEFEAWRADSELKTELDALQSSYSNYDWKSDTGEGNLRQQLVQYMHQNKVYDPEIALKAMMYGTDIQAARMSAERKAAEDAARQRKLGVVAPGTQAAPQAQPKPIDYRQSYDDLAEQALAEFGQRR